MCIARYLLERESEIRRTGAGLLEAGDPPAMTLIPDTFREVTISQALLP
jgi:hypothetical protein